MQYPYDLLPLTWQWLALALSCAALTAAALRAPWRRLGRSEYLHVFLGSCVALMLLWSIKADAVPGMEYHLVGATLLTLMFGWALALIGISGVMLALVLSGAGDWQTLPVNALLLGTLPVFVSHLIYRLVERKLPNHFFVYVFLSAFFSAGIAVGASVLAASALVIFSGVYALQSLAYDYLPYVPLMMFPEAFITGMLITTLIVFRPGWVATFDDDRYIKGK